MNSPSAPLPLFPHSPPSSGPCGWSQAAPPLPVQDIGAGAWPQPPFVLLDDARSGHPARLYADPRAIITAHAPGDVVPALARLRDAVKGGAHVAGYLAYEAGLALEPRLAPLAASLPGNAPLLWFGVFDAPRALPMPSAPEGNGPRGPVQPVWDEQRHGDALDQVLALIRSGDCYQVNLTFPAHMSGLDDPMAHYAALRAGQRAGWGGVVATGDRWLLSCSPELFFVQSDRTLWARPMKGTAKRGETPEQDAEFRNALWNSVKDRAENLMIVDLLRNDLSRVAQPGSVRTPRLFDIESYPTVHQMTSTITARMRDDVDTIDIIHALFPCGSVTGAPKIRAMEIIADVEAGQRGAYTGSMGFIAPDGTCAFNVMIRTLELDKGTGDARLGLGSGIVADSDAAQEWAECLAKAVFAQ